MSGDSSWMMSGASPPSNAVTSWSCTLSQLPGTYSTWIFGCAEFHCATSFLLAAMDSFCQARLRNLSLTGPSEPDEEQADRPVAASAAAGTAARRRRRCMWTVLCGELALDGTGQQAG